MKSRSRSRYVTILCAALVSAILINAAAQNLPDQDQLQQVREYIKKSWTTLSRSNRDLPRALPDPKMPRPPGARWLLYIASTESKARVERELTQVLDAASMKQIEIRTLP